MQSALFTINPIRPDIYDLEPNYPFPFRYCRISEPRTEWLQKQGAKWVLEVWEHGRKSLFTGLRPTADPGQYTGDLLLPDGRHQILAYQQYPGTIRINILDKKSTKRLRIK